MRGRYLFGGLLIGGIALADLYIKRLVATSFIYGDRIEVIPGFFALTYILNAGAAFGIMANWGSRLRVPILLVTSIIAIGFIVYLYFSAPSSNKIARLALPFIAGGALANLYERITAGAVVDYLDFYVYGYHWPAFNPADASITVSVALLLRFKRELEKRSACSYKVLLAMKRLCGIVGCLILLLANAAWALDRCQSFGASAVGHDHGDGVSHVHSDHLELSWDPSSPDQQTIHCADSRNVLSFISQTPPRTILSNAASRILASFIVPLMAGASGWITYSDKRPPGSFFSSISPYLSLSVLRI